VTALDTAAKLAGQQRPGRSGTPVRGLLPLLVGLGIWQMVGDPASPYFPPPSEWYAAVLPLARSGELLPALGWTTLTFLTALGLATLMGSAVGVAVGSHRRADRACGPSFEFLRVLPAAALVPIATLLLGHTMTMKLSVTVLPTMWPILLTVRASRRSMNSVLLDVPRTLGLSISARIFKVVLPALTQPILLGIRLAAPLALVITLLVEIVTRINGLGALLADAQAQFFSAQVYGLLVMTGSLGFLVNWVVTHLEGAVATRLGVQF
jgi:ABC-type nitrate/sulfonate/bicarbonate transport system permease component